MEVDISIKKVLYIYSTLFETERVNGTCLSKLSCERYFSAFNEVYSAVFTACEIFHQEKMWVFLQIQHIYIINLFTCAYF